MLYNILMIIFIIVFIVDYSGIVGKFSRWIYQLFTGFVNEGYMIPLISCSLCSTFWAVLGYCLLNNVSILHSLFTASISAYIASFLNELLTVIKDLYIKLLAYANKK